MTARPFADLLGIDGAAHLRPILLDFADRSDLRTIADGWRHRIDIHAATTDRRPADALLIRRDAHVVWGASIDEHTDTAASARRESLSYWFGTPIAPETGAVIAGGSR
jgi:hypothetical protein